MNAAKRTIPPVGQATIEAQAHAAGARRSWPEPNYTTSCTVCGHIAAHLEGMSCAQGCGYCLRRRREAAELRWAALGGAARERQLQRAAAKAAGTRTAELAEEELAYMRAVRAGDAS